MSTDRMLLRLSENLSKGYLADEILTIIYKVRHGIQLLASDNEFLNGLKESFEGYSHLADADPFSFAINNSLVSEETTRPFIRRLEPGDLNAFKSFSITIRDIVEGRKPEEEKLKPLEDHFKKLLKDSLSRGDSITQREEEGEPMYI